MPNDAGGRVAGAHAFMHKLALIYWMVKRILCTTTAMLCTMCGRLCARGLLGSAIAMPPHRVWCLCGASVVDAMPSGSLILTRTPGTAAAAVALNACVYVCVPACVAVLVA